MLCSKNPATANLSIYSEAEEQLGKKLQKVLEQLRQWRLEKKARATTFRTLDYSRFTQ